MMIRATMRPKRKLRKMALYYSEALDKAARSLRYLRKRKLRLKSPKKVFLDA